MFFAPVNLSNGREHSTSCLTYLKVIERDKKSNPYLFFFVPEN